MAGHTERMAQDLAEEFGLHPGEVWREMDEVAERIRRFGPESVDELIRRCAVEFDLPEDELWAEYAQVVARRQRQAMVRCAG